MTYNPLKDLLLENIKAIIDGVDMLLLWNNSKYDHAEILNTFSCKDSKIKIAGDGTNIGIAVALNYAWKYARENNFEYLLTMDQDSVFEDFDLYKTSCYEMFKTRDCIIGPLYNKEPVMPAEFVKIDSPFLITSGMLVPVIVLDIIGGYNDNLFVDCIDVDLCTKCIIYNIPIYQYNGARIRQHFGEPKNKVLLGWRFKGADYNVDRLYNVFKNILTIYHLYNKPSFLRKKIIEYYRNFIIDAITSDHEKYKKILAIIRGSVKGFLLTY